MMMGWCDEEGINDDDGDDDDDDGLV